MRLRTIGALAATLALTVTAACGSSGSTDEPSAAPTTSSSDAGEQPETTTLKIGLTPVSAVAPIYLGMEKGIFAEHGLELEIVKGIGGPSAVAAIESGNVDVAIAAPDTMLQTASKGLPYLSIANAGGVGPDGVGGSQVVVKAGSDIKTPADLNGKTVGVFILQGANELNVRYAIDEAGGDSSTVKFVNLEFAAMLSALDRGDIDAAGIAEPILSQAIDDGAVEVVLDYYPVVFPEGGTITLWFTGQKQLDSNADALERFRTALQEAATYSDEHSDDVRAILPDFSGISAEDAATVPLQKYDLPLTEDVFQRTADVMKKYGTLDESYEMNFQDLMMP